MCQEKNSPADRTPISVFLKKTLYYSYRTALGRRHDEPLWRKIPDPDADY
jgi:hypothetical protein